MRIEAALTGDLERILREEYEDVETAVQGGVTEAANGLKGELRAQVEVAGLGRGVANAWRSKVYPQVGKSAEAAGVVFSKAPSIHRAFEEGSVIRSKSGTFLAIPTENAPKRGANGKRISPSNFPEHRFGRLRFVYRRGAPSLLIAEGLRASFSRKTGQMRGFRRASEKARASGRGLATAIMFLLVPQVRLRKLLNVGGAAQRWIGRLPALVVKHFPHRPEGGR